MKARFCCDQLCEQGRRCPNRPPYPNSFAPGVIEGPFPTHSPRQLLWRWMRRTLALMAAVALAGLVLGYLS